MLVLALTSQLVSRRQSHSICAISSYVRWCSRTEGGKGRELTDADFDEVKKQPEVSTSGRNSAAEGGPRAMNSCSCNYKFHAFCTLPTALSRGISSRILHFEINVDEAIARFESNQVNLA